MREGKARPAPHAGAGFCLPDYLIPEVATPSTKCFWAKKKTSMGGTMDRTRSGPWMATKKPFEMPA